MLLFEDFNDEGDAMGCRILMDVQPSKKEEDWKWTVVKSIPISELDQEKYPVPGKPGEFYKTRMDMEGVKRFEQLEFMDAAEELGMFGNLKNK